MIYFAGDTAEQSLAVHWPTCRQGKVAVNLPRVGACPSQPS
ncbi:hypothetical protein [Pseudarthrobacter sulfonivorans]|nr:hypothetical protein [Pseudarthrobacter sulfonivorans]